MASISFRILSNRFPLVVRRRSTRKKIMNAPAMCWIGGAIGLLLKVTLLSLFAVQHSNAQQSRDFSKAVPIKYYRYSVNDVVELEVPEGFIDRWVTGVNISGNRDALYFRATGANFMPESPSNASDFKYPDSHFKELRFTVNSLFRLPPELINERTERNFQGQLQIDAFPCQYRLGESRRYGLMRRVVDPESCPKERDSPRDDVYYAKHHDGRLKTVMRCSAEAIKEPPPNRVFDGTPRPVPRCQHMYYLVDMNGWVILNYARLHLPLWQQLEQISSERLRSFVKSK